MIVETPKGKLSCTSMQSTYRGKGSVSCLLSHQTAGTHKAAYSGRACAIAEIGSESEHLIFARDLSKAAGAIVMRELLKRSPVTGTHRAGKSRRFTHRGHRCIRGAATRTTTDFTVMAGAAFRFAPAGNRLKGSSKTWGARGCRVFQLTESTMTEITSPATADGLLRSSNLRIETHGVAEVKRRSDARAKIKVAADLYPFRFIAIKAKAKRDGGGWDVEEF